MQLLFFRNGNQIGEQDLPPANSGKKKKKLTWDNEDIDVQQLIFPEPNFSEYKNKTTTELFEIFFDDNVWTLLVSESSRYVLFFNQPDPKITIEEYKVFIGILYQVDIMNFRVNVCIGNQKMIQKMY